MKKIFYTLLIILFLSLQQTFAEQVKIVVIPDNLFFIDKDYLVYPEIAEYVARDVINQFKTHNIISPQIATIKDIVNSNYKLKSSTENAIARYKIGYTVDFNNIELLSKAFKTRYILLITCNLDSQNYVMRRTLWDFANIPGAAVVDPAYRLTTYATLVDAQRQVIVWQEQYNKLISSRENRMIATTFGPPAEQLEKIYTYTTRYLAPEIGQKAQIKTANKNYIALRPELVRSQWWTLDKGKDVTKSAVNLSTKVVYLGSDFALQKGKQKGIQIGKFSKRKYNEFKVKRAQQAQMRTIIREEKAKLKAKIKEEKARLEKENAEALEKVQLEKNEPKFQQIKQQSSKTMPTTSNENNASTVEFNNHEVINDL